MRCDADHAVDVGLDMNDHDEELVGLLLIGLLTIERKEQGNIDIDVDPVSGLAIEHHRAVSILCFHYLQHTIATISYHSNSNLIKLQR
jgi:hypothetical protein